MKGVSDQGGSTMIWLGLLVFSGEAFISSFWAGELPLAINRIYLQTDSRLRAWLCGVSRETLSMEKVSWSLY